MLIGVRTNRPGRVQGYLDGTIEDVQIYSYAITPDQVLEMVPPPRLENWVWQEDPDAVPDLIRNRVYYRSDATVTIES